MFFNVCLQADLAFYFRKKKNCVENQHCTNAPWLWIYFLCGLLNTTVKSTNGRIGHPLILSSKTTQKSAFEEK